MSALEAIAAAIRATRERGGVTGVTAVHQADVTGESERNSLIHKEFSAGVTPVTGVTCPIINGAEDALDSVQAATPGGRPDALDVEGWHRAYMAHHGSCPKCISASRGYGERCPDGAMIWSQYRAASACDEARKRREKQADESRDQDCIALIEDAQEERLESHRQRALALGASAEAAEAAAQALLLKDEFDERVSCLACKRCRRSKDGPFCSALDRPALLGLHRCGHFRPIDVIDQGKRGKIPPGNS